MMIISLSMLSKTVKKLTQFPVMFSKSWLGFARVCLELKIFILVCLFRVILFIIFVNDICNGFRYSNFSMLPIDVNIFWLLGPSVVFLYLKWAWIFFVLGMSTVWMLECASVILSQNCLFFDCCLFNWFSACEER